MITRGRRPYSFQRRTPDKTLLREGREDRGGIYEGTVGWSDGADHFDLEDSGVALIKVTLFDGRNPDTDNEAKTDLAQGSRILARIDPEKDDIPPDGTRVVVAVPARRNGPGGAVILKSVRPDAKFVPLRKPGEKIQLGPASNFMRMHADGSISLFTRTEDNDQGKSVYLQVRPDGFRLVHPHVKCTLDGTGFHVNHSSGARIDMGAVSGLPAPLDTLGNYIKLSAAMLRLESSAVILGAAAGVGTPPARSDQVILALAAIISFLPSVATAVGGAGSPAGAAAAATALTTAIGALTAAMTGFEAAIPATSTMVT